MKKSIVLFCLSFLYQVLNAQVSPGQWTEHISYYSCKSVALANEKIYCAAEAGMFYFNKTDQSINPFNKLNGLSDINISVLRFDESLQILVIGYENGNIDLLSPESGKVFNIPDLRNKSINFSKRINNICISNKMAYLACDFGVLVINLEKKEIADTYYIGDLGDMTQVNDITIYNQTIYAATSQGLRSCPLSSDFPSDYHSWTKENVPYTGSKATNALGIVNKKLMVSATYHKESIADDIFMLSNGVWSSTLFNIPFVNKMITENGKMAICGQSKLLVFNDDGSEYLSMDKFDRGMIKLKDACIDKDGAVWISDSTYALGKILNSKVERKTANCPRNSGVTHIAASSNNEVWIAGGGPSSQWSGYGGYRYSNGNWKAFNYETYFDSYTVNNFYKVAISPYDPSHVFFGSWGFGLIEFQNDQFVKIYDDKNSVLKPVYNTRSYLFVSGVAFDNQDNLWITTSAVPQIAYVKKANSKAIDAIPLNYKGAQNQAIGDIMVTDNGTKWIILKGYGILAFNDKGNELSFTIKDDKGVSVSSNPSCMAQDKDGAVWVGTDAGIAIYTSPENVFGNQGFYAYRPVVSNQYLLSSEKITSIAVDGANRKWIGTENSGVFLVSANGTEQIKHYTSDNSPLLSNQIISIGINPQSGEVFIGTNYGLVSVGSDASSGKQDFEGIYCYPNPVRPGYKGDVTIGGLMDNSNIKITDVAGNLVYEVQSQGGTATWNGKNLHGAGVASGVYLIFCTNSDGSQSKVTKLLFIK